MAKAKGKAKVKVKAPEDMRFEEAYEELVASVGKLEAGDLELEDSLTLFERGRALSERCSELLEEAELKLRELAPDSYSESIEGD